MAASQAEFSRWNGTPPSLLWQADNASWNGPPEPFPKPKPPAVILCVAGAGCHDLHDTYETGRAPSPRRRKTHAPADAGDVRSVYAFKNRSSLPGATSSRPRRRDRPRSATVT
jgi:hypothetical protein